MLLLGGVWLALLLSLSLAISFARLPGLHKALGGEPTARERFQGSSRPDCATKATYRAISRWRVG